MVWELLFRGFRELFLGFSGNRGLVKISVWLSRHFDFQGLVGFGSVYFVLCWGGWFLDGFGNGFFVILGLILGAFWLQQSINNGINFGIDF